MVSLRIFFSDRVEICGKGEAGFRAFPVWILFQVRAVDREELCHPAWSETNLIHFEECKWANAYKV